MDLSEFAEQPLRKLRRAEALFAESINLTQRWMDAEPFQGEYVPSPDRLRMDVVLRRQFPFPLDDIADVIGDAVHNVRAALDHLAWGLCNHSGPTKNPRRIYFPICMTEGEWTKAKKDLTEAPVETFEKLHFFQPLVYEDPKTALLYILHRLDIADKHRGFLRPSVTPGALELTFPGMSWEPGTTAYFEDNRAMLHEALDGQPIVSAHFSKPFVHVATSPTAFHLATTLKIGTSETPQIELAAMAHDMVLQVRNIIETVCGLPISQGIPKGGALQP